jgi:hypothetical protein
MALHGRVRWIVTAAALAALAIGMSPGSRDVSAKTQFIGADHIVSWSALPDATGQMCLWPDESSYQRRGGGAGEPAQASSAPSYTTPTRVTRRSARSPWTSRGIRWW